MGTSHFLSFSDFKHAVSSALSVVNERPEGIDDLADRMDAIEQALRLSKRP